MDMLSIEYRLAGHYSFPAQLQDAISSYVYLTKKLNIPADKVNIHHYIPIMGIFVFGG